MCTHHSNLNYLMLCLTLQVHTMECPNSLVNCSLKCGLTLTRKELNTHITNECTKRLVPCIHCSNKVAADSMEVSQQYTLQGYSLFLQYCKVIPFSGPCTHKPTLRRNLQSSSTRVYRRLETFAAIERFRHEREAMAIIYLLTRFFGV